MKLDPKEVRRWLANFDAAKEVERDLVKQEGSRPTWAIEAALSLISAVEKQGGWFDADPLREQSEESVRATWVRLRKRLVA